MYASGYIFQKGFFDAWIVVSIIWVWITMLISGFYPIVDGREQIRLVYQGLFQKGGARGTSSDGTIAQGETQESMNVPGKEI